MPLKLVKDTTGTVTVRAKSATKAEIVIYGSIGQSWDGEGVTAKKFAEELKALGPNVTDIDVRINSGGGDVFDGITIYNRLKQHKAKKTVYIDGLAASIASVIALAGDEIIMSEGALYMIHLPWTFAIGNRKELDATVDRLLDVEEAMIGLYAKRSKLSRAEIKLMLEEETWMDGETAKDHGFVDTIAEEAFPIAAMLKSSWIKNAPKNVKTDQDLAKEKIENLKNKIEGFLARK